MNKLIVTILIFLFSLFNASGQRYYSRNYDINSGLPDNCIREIFKDNRGFLWIGTDAGLARFDGKNFNIYTSQDGLAGNKIWSITESKNGNIWIGCHDGGLSVFNGREIISYTTESSGLISNEIRKVYYSKKKDIVLIGTEDGLSVFQNNKFLSFHSKLNNVKQKLQINYIIESNDIIYIFTNDNELYEYVPETKSLLRISTDHPLNRQYSNSAYISSFGDTLINLDRNNILSIHNGKQRVNENIGEIKDYKEDLNQNIWIAAWDNNYNQFGGLFKYDSTGLLNYNKYIGIKTNNLLSLEFDSKEDLLWIGTKEHGLYLYPLTNFSYYKADDFNLPELNITDLKSDKLGNLWICTKNTIIKKQPDSNKIFPVELFASKIESFIQNAIKRKYSFLIDSEGSYNKYQDLISTGKYSFANPYKNLNGKEYPAKYFYKPLKYDVIINKKLTEFNSLTRDTLGNIWVGSNVGIFKIDKETDQIQFFDVAGNQFKRFYIDKKNRLFGLGWSELLIYPDIENNSGHYYFDYYEDKSPINVTSIRSHDNTIWFASSDHGLFVYHENKFYSTYDNQNIGTPSFNDLCVDKFGNIVAAGNDGIIYIVQFSNDSIKLKHSVNLKNRNLGTNIRYLNCNKNQQLIVGSNAGLNIIDLEKLYETGETNIENINESEGFIDYSGKISITQDHKILWIGSNSNLIKANLIELNNRNDRYYNFFIKSIYVNDELLNLNESEKNPWTNIPKIVINLPYYKNSITINFDAIRYLNPDDTKFSYKLEGFQKKWINAGKEGKAIFQNLKPGRYRLRIKLTSKDRDISNQELSINFKIDSPIWLKWWVILSGLILLTIFIRGFIVLRTRSIKKRERLKTEIAERITVFELKALRAQMNPHFIFNAINSIQNYMLDNDIDAALNYLSDFAKLIRLTLDNVSKKRISLDDELNYLKYYVKLEQMRFDKKFDLKIHVPSDVENSKILIPSMILQPYIENAIKHGFVFKKTGGKIKLEFQLTEDNILKCIIEDNGIGRKKSRELNKNKNKHNSKGTFITTERLSLLNQTQPRKGYKVETIDLYDEFDLVCGTRVEISIPV